jgi:hypothetical protein
MNARAARTSGDALFILHADYRLEKGAFAAAARRLRQPSVAAGCPKSRVEADGLAYRLRRYWWPGCLHADLLAGFYPVVR